MPQPKDPPTEPSTPSPSPWQSLLATTQGLNHLPPFLLPLVLINMTAHMALSGGRVTGSLYILQNGAAEFVVGLFMALFAIVPIFTALSIGRWTDRVGAPKVMRRAICMVVLGAWLPVLYLSVPILLIAAIIVGFGFNMFSVAGQHTVGNLVTGMNPSERLSNFGWYAMGHSVSSTLGPFIAGILIDTLGHRAAFAALACFSCIAALLIYTKIRKLPHFLHPLPASIADAAGDTNNLDEIDAINTKPQRVLDLLASPEMRRIYWVNMNMSLSWDFFLVMLPILGHRAGYSASVIGLVFSLFAFGTFTSRAAMPWLSKRANEWQIIRAVTCIIALVFIMLPFASTAFLLMIFGYIFGLAVGTSQPNMLSLLHSAAPQGRGGEAVGLRSVIGNSCSVIIPIAFGALVVPLGLSTLLVGGGLFFASAIPSAYQGAQGAKGRSMRGN